MISTTDNISIRVRFFIKDLLPPFLFRLLKKIKQKNTKYYGLNKLDEKIEKYLNYENGFFVELGANDGITQFNTKYFERYKNWKGILIEPSPNNYLLCRENRSSKTNIFCNACTSFEYKDKFVEIAYSNLMSSPIGLESDLENPFMNAMNGKKFLSATENIFTFGAIATTLNNLLVKGNAPNTIDLLSLDVEGAEIEVLKGIDHNKFRFKILCIESRDKEKLISFLQDYDYQLLEQISNHDYLFRDARNYKQ
ncbi:FkbM family methyltransferase [Fluviispira sanaruensis]|uniref:FkbM family methyltransferase n=1 Tax=Fluviispira sanaruensis TaxID=2493639 RepID=A0A4P2VYA8_FLUSA|nr:FkbM family methyltransferase [Fluviispira sanaruensis]BBH54042.1 FkbM family methyltransferase [Fluviispira sanaruensis]